MNRSLPSREVPRRDYETENEGCRWPGTRHKVYVNNSTNFNTGGGTNGLGQTIQMYFYDQVHDDDAGWEVLRSGEQARARTTCVNPGGSRRIRFDLYKTKEDGNHIGIAGDIAKTQSTDAPEDSHSHTWSIVTELIEDNGPVVVVYLQWYQIVGEEPVPFHRVLNRFSRDDWLAP